MVFIFLGVIVIICYHFCTISDSQGDLFSKMGDTLYKLADEINSKFIMSIFARFNVNSDTGSEM